MTKIKPEATLGEIGIEEKKPTYTQTPRTPTLEEAKNMERILIGTEYNNGAYVAKATYDGIPLKTNGFEKPYLALRHLMNVIVERQLVKGKKRNEHFIFTSPIN